MTHWINIVPLAMIVLGCLLFLNSSRKIIVFGSVIMILIAEFGLSIQYSILQPSLVRLISSASALFVIYITMKENDIDFGVMSKNSRIFRITAYVIFAILSILLGLKLTDYLRLPVEIAIGGLFSLFCGLLYLGISSTLSKLFLAIMVFYAGFSLIFGILESSILVNGLIAIVILLLGALGSYLIIREVMVDRE